MDNPASVERFLRYGMGYEKLSHCVTGHKPEGVKIGQYLQGTILGTIRTRATMIARELEVNWESHFKITPRIQPVSELEETIKDKYWGKYIHIEDASLPYFVGSGIVFNNLTGKQTREMLDEQISTAFPGRKTNYVYTGQFSVTFEAEDFKLEAGGGTNRSVAKFIFANFNVNPDLVIWVNQTVKQYSGIMRSFIERKEAQN